MCMCKDYLNVLYPCVISGVVVVLVAVGVVGGVVVVVLLLFFLLLLLLLKLALVAFVAVPGNDGVMVLVVTLPLHRF